MRDVPVCLAVTRFKIEFVLPLPACQHYLITSVCEAIQLEDNNNSGSTFAVVYSLCVSDTLYGLCIYLNLSLPFCVDTGVLIVSVQWRNKTFSGSLIDMSQHEWAPPRYAHTKQNTLA